LRGDFRGHAFVPLLEERAASQSLELLRSRVRADSPAPISCVKAPIGGLTFVSASGEISGMLDAWWSHVVPVESLPVLLMFHEPGLESWVRHIDAEVVLGVQRLEDRSLYAGLDNVRVVVAQDVPSLTEHAIQLYGRCFAGGAEERATPAPAPPSPAGSGSGTPFKPRTAPPPVALADQRPTAGFGDRSSVRRPESPVLATRPQRPGLARDLRAFINQATGRRSALPEELTSLALSHQTGKIVGVSSRAGGVGKTAVAAALGIVYGEAVQESGWCAAVVDQNVGNPDQWGRLSLTSEVDTVSEIMSDIEAGREWTVPAWSRTPALAVYPERRDLGDVYTQAQVEQFAEHLRQLHMIAVVDLPNRIPSPRSAESALCASWVGVSDLLLLPTTDDPTRLQGVLDYLEAPMVRGDAQAGLLPIRVIVPYLRSPLRAVRSDPNVLGMLELIRERVLAVVEVPKNERATLAIVKGRPITEVDESLREAYVELALTVARALLG
jgi:cellulose biosynthesis protein BcsQ